MTDQPSDNPDSPAVRMLREVAGKALTERDRAYRERNQLVALLSTLYPSKRARTHIPGWDPAWHGCVFIEFPTFQGSWHYHDDDADLFEHLPDELVAWDGHTTEEKYERIAGLARCRAAGAGHLGLMGTIDQ